MDPQSFSIQDFTPPKTGPSAIKEKRYHVSSQDDVSGSSNKAQIRVKLTPPVARPAGMQLLSSYIPAAIWNLQNGQSLHLVQNNSEVLNFTLYFADVANQNDSGGNWSLSDLADFILQNIQQAQSFIASPQDFFVDFRPERNVISIWSPVEFDIIETEFSQTLGWTQGSDNTGIFWAESPTPLDLNESVHAVFLQFANLGWANVMGSSSNTNLGFAKISAGADGAFSVDEWHHLSRYTAFTHSSTESIEYLDINIVDQNGAIVQFLTDWHITLRFFYFAQ